MSADPEAYYNPTAEPVTISDYINPTAVLRKAAKTKHETYAQKSDGTLDTANVHDTTEPPDDVIAAIKRKLDIGRKSVQQKPTAYVPDELNRIIDDLRAFIESFGITVSSIDNIQYGKRYASVLMQKRPRQTYFMAGAGIPSSSRHAQAQMPKPTNSPPT